MNAPTAIQSSPTHGREHVRGCVIAGAVCAAVFFVCQRHAATQAPFWAVAVLVLLVATPLALDDVSAKRLAANRSGWPSSLAICLAAVGLTYAALLLGVKHWAGALFLHPTAGDSLAWLGRRLLLVAPAAFAEEIFFRGWLQETILRPWGRRRSLCLAALIFALAHVPTFDSLAESALRLPGLLASGLVLGWLVRRSGGSLWPSIFLHALGNVALVWFRQLAQLNLPFAP